MSIHVTKNHAVQGGELTLDYIVKDWHTDPSYYNRRCAECAAHAFGFEGWDPLDEAFFTEDEISELMHESGMSCPEDDKYILFEAQQSLDGPIWVAENSEGEDENLPHEIIEHLEFCEDYEDSLHLERVKNAEVNLHRYLAVEHKYRENSSEPKNDFTWENHGNWEELAVVPESMAYYTIGQLLCKDRITCEVTILNPFPEDRRGYALGVSQYGKVFIPEKFRRYIPDAGKSIAATVALSDIELHNGRPKMCRLNLIYIHRTQD